MFTDPDLKKYCHFQTLRSEGQLLKPQFFSGLFESLKYAKPDLINIEIKSTLNFTPKIAFLKRSEFGFTKHLKTPKSHSKIQPKIRIFFFVVKKLQIFCIFQGLKIKF